jgi:hypothetical protein
MAILNSLSSKNKFGLDRPNADLDPNDENEMVTA